MKREQDEQEQKQRRGCTDLLILGSDFLLERLCFATCALKLKVCLLARALKCLERNMDQNIDKVLNIENRTKDQRQSRTATVKRVYRDFRAQVGALLREGSVCLLQIACSASE